MYSILVIDDEESICNVIETLLCDDRLDIDKAIRLNDAIELLNNNSYDLVFTDMQMFGTKDGLAILEHCKQQAHDPKVIIVTAHGSLSEVENAGQLGAAGYLFKPFSNKEIYDLVDLHLGVSLHP